MVTQLSKYFSSGSANALMVCTGFILSGCGGSTSEDTVQMDIPIVQGSDDYTVVVPELTEHDERLLALIQELDLDNSLNAGLNLPSIDDPGAQLGKSCFLAKA
ncbi:hypothetical protein [Thalassotalea eurytherma]|uniref:Uncharacterized protein n=1 Tax=Thalassotalea eurytherma TaxID=1144278 RepID=A0ABQ6H423_9GAMM|nr:hypothetical protein [Thalassotalea eurytherma]GLX82920.1 hypothetical protein theurythT_23720 [Thalassotalea eurytherma]